MIDNFISYISKKIYLTYIVDFIFSSREGFFRGNFNGVKPQNVLGIILYLA